jgi:hypothetical protein
MTPKERVLAALEGQPVDRFPTGGLYHHLYVELDFAELTDEPPWRVHTLPYLEPDEYMAMYRKIVERAPFDILEPMGGNQPRQVRRRNEFVEKDGRPYRHDTQTDEWFPLDEPTKSGHVHDVVVSEAQRVFTRRDIDEEFKIVRAEDICPDGQLDPLEAAIAEFGDDHFILRDGPGGALAWCTAYFGMTNTMMMLIEQPDLIEHMIAKSLEQGIETLRRLAAIGVDGVYSWEALGTGELISPAHYEKLCLPYRQALVEEARSLGLKTIVAFYGDVMDRLDLIAATGADALQAECAMKGHTNNMYQIADAIGDRMTLFANIDPFWCLEKATEEQLAIEIERQIGAGRKARGFVLSPASPITPGTPLARVRRFIELCHELGQPVD